MNAPTRPHDQRELLNHDELFAELNRIGNSDTIFRAQGRIITLKIAYELVTTLPRKSWSEVIHELDKHKITREMYNALMKISDSIVADYEGEFHPPVAHDASPHGMRPAAAPRDLPKRPEYIGENEFDSMRSNGIDTRRKVFELLSRGEATVDSASKALSLSYFAVQQHLKALVEIGKAHVARTVGRQQFFALGPTAPLTQAPEKPNHAPEPNAQPDQATRATNEQPSTAAPNQHSNAQSDRNRNTVLGSLTDEFQSSTDIFWKARSGLTQATILKHLRDLASLGLAEARRVDKKKIEFRRRNTNTDALAAPTPPDTLQETHDASLPAEGPMHSAPPAPTPPNAPEAQPIQWNGIFNEQHGIHEMNAALTRDIVTFAKVLEDLTRIHILRIISSERITVTDLAKRLKISQPSISHHIAFLAEADFVSMQKDGKKHFYSVTPRFAEQAHQWKAFINLLFVTPEPTVHTPIDCIPEHAVNTDTDIPARDSTEHVREDQEPTDDTDIEVPARDSTEHECENQKTMNDTENRILACIVSVGSATIDDIMQITGFSRPTAYKYRDSLEKRRLIIRRTNGRTTMYSPLNAAVPTEPEVRSDESPLPPLAHDATATESEPTLPRHADASAEVRTILDAPLPYVETPLEQIVHGLRISLALLQAEVSELRADNARLNDTILDLRSMLAQLLAQRADALRAASNEEHSTPTETSAPSMLEPVETHGEHEPGATVIPIADDAIIEAKPCNANDAASVNDDHDTSLQEHVPEETNDNPETLDVENAPIVHTPPPTTPARGTPVSMRRRRTNRTPDGSSKPKRSRAQTSPTGSMPHFTGDPTRVTPIIDPAKHRDTSLAQHLAKLQMTDAPAVLEAVTTLSKLMNITDKNEKGTALTSFYDTFLQRHPSLNKQLLIQWYLLGAPGIAALERACDQHAKSDTSDAMQPIAVASSPSKKPRCPGQRFSIDPYATPFKILESRQVPSDDDPIAELLLRLDGNLKQDEWDLYASYAESARLGVINTNVRQKFAAMLAKAYPYIPPEHVTQICELMFTTARTPLQDIQWNMYVKQYFTFN